ncbi:anaerobic ribonucleoside-triphosphate reductase [Lacticaseibacillus paracasei]|uniref:Ribonucleoside-triphosphate reductase class III catalytic subunit / ribonucleoside-triphosphate reductase n=1 Tax=Lacticaseibacillus paracasei (strain ATCC 334 / BCRC 17002 / CCUG 31169 / CIP 107868 / KCTC 3260 / NRRL B-441) TaxID=321967 RepID=Q03CS7_LACP3|nr:anaerobic ribonucleoside-triphosphate reductase [Lacticaseibacillus paracasei]ABJ68995.1 ribonucleoside-triphosphate reductase class III catalytic subunit / ribonucleoside-triphosphate reductase [Lacticaseibacillus paracasei ATCC 334]KRK15639.1 anaerobic ribonucleoside triphosphate reductase [Lacticaseibacillus casei DSM 20011 = JCM 1134 = ATCC 393]OSY80314.1 anaerobic ribonucleoside-triphosphate reductase [Lacticaseibacillus paracasei]
MIEFYTQIKKRDGRIVNFDASKISTAITKAAESVAKLAPSDVLTIDHLTDTVTAKIRDRYHDDVEIAEIQTVVEQTLIAAEKYNWAEAYTEYRLKRDLARKQKQDVNYNVSRLVNRDESVVNENANKDSRVFSTQRDLTAGAVAKAIGLKMLPPAVANAHLRGDIHWHDLDYTPFMAETNCCLIDFDYMLNHGFSIGNAEVEPAHSIQVAVTQMTQIIANVASSQYGGCSSDRTDQVLAPFAEKNYQKHLREFGSVIDDPAKLEALAVKQTKKDIYDALQTLEYQVNTLYSTQGQTPFVTVGFGLGTSWIEREIQKDILKIRILGLGKERRTAIFPKLVFTLKRGLNLKPEDPNYDIKQLAIECATKRMYPDVVSYDTIKRLTGSFKAPMGCRSFLQGWTDPKTGKEVNAGRMNLGVITVNLPRIAMEANGDKAKFWKIFEERMRICKEGLLYKVERTKQATPESAPILYKYGAFGHKLADTDSIDDLFKNGRATVSLGYIGLYEVGTVFYGSAWEKNPDAKAFSVSIVKALDDHCKAWEKQYGYHFSVYGTPSESLTDTFCRADTKKFGIVKDITDKEYYTNSFHYDVRKSPTPFEKLDFEKDYPQYSAGGFIHYCEYPNLKQNPKALEAVWDYAYDKIGYLGTNTPIDQCFKCGFKGEFTATAKGYQCPECGNHDPATCDVVKRLCGYLGNPNKRPMVHGRQEEIIHRKKHITFSLNQVANRRDK